MKRITNLTGGQFVATLADGSTLRIDHKGFAEVKDENLTPYFNTVESKELVKIESIGDTNKKSAAKAVTKEE